MEALRGAIGVGDDSGSIGEWCSLSYEQRLIGFAVCFVFGLILSFMSSIFIASFNATKFGLCYTIGAILSVFSTMFLWGPVKQCKSMWAKERVLWTGLYFLFMALTLWAAFGPKSPGLVILFLIFQMIAMAWYSLSYIPGGHSIVINCFKRCVPCTGSSSA